MTCQLGISLTDRLDRFVETSVSTGRYQNASEVVREGLRLLEYRHQEDMLKLRHLRKAIQEGEDALAHDGIATSMWTNCGSSSQISVLPEGSDLEHRLWRVSG